MTEQEMKQEYSSLHHSFDMYELSQQIKSLIGDKLFSSIIENKDSLIAIKLLRAIVYYNVNVVYEHCWHPYMTYIMKRYETPRDYVLKTPLRLKDAKDIIDIYIKKEEECVVA